MTFRPSKKFASVALLVSLTVGCQSGTSRREVARVEADQTRDTAAAQRDTAAAVDLIGEGDLGGAERVLRAAIAADATYGPAHNDLGRVYFEQSRLYQAAWEFQTAAKLMPGAAEPKNNLGLVLERAGRLDEAIRQFDDALAIAPYQSDYLGNAARARLRRGDRDEKVRSLLEAILLSDSRDQWKDWASAQLMRLKHRSFAPATTQAHQLP